jgi:hypothetical protein
VTKAHIVQAIAEGVSEVPPPYRRHEEAGHGANRRAAVRDRLAHRVNAAGETEQAPRSRPMTLGAGSRRSAGPIYRSGGRRSRGAEPGETRSVAE